MSNGTPAGKPNANTAPGGRFGAFQSFNFRAYFVGQLLSTIGTWSQTLALVTLVLQLTNRSDKLGITIALQFLPLLLLGALTGVVADKFDNRLLLVATSAAAGLLAVVFGVIVQTGHVTMAAVYALTFGYGLVTAVERPTMQAIVFQLVGPERLTSGIAINQMINTAGRLVGPAIAGVVIAVFGLAACFYVNAASYLVVIAALLALRAHELVPRPKLTRTKGQLREGLRYVRRNPDVLRPLVVMAVLGTIAYNFQTTIPAMVKFQFEGGSGSLAAAFSVSAIGSIAGGLFIAGRTIHPRRTLGLVLVAWTLGSLAFGLSPNFALFIAAGIPLGFISSVFLTVDSVALQQATEPGMQGRVMALHQIAWMGSTPIGALLMGAVIELTTPRWPFLIGSLSALVCAVAVLAGGWREQRAVQPADVVGEPAAAMAVQTRSGE